MSAIWGVIDFHGKPMEEHLAKKMEEPYHQCKIDQYKTYQEDGILLSYGGQHFTPEAKLEQQPLVETKQKRYFLADAVIDNREDLFELLSIPDADKKHMPDGTLMLQILNTYGNSGWHDFLGTFTYALYDKKKKELRLVTDAIGSRCLYYCYEGGKVYFSTLIQPIIMVRKNKTKFNYRFITDFLAMDNYALYTEAEETIHDGIYKVAPGQMVCIGPEGIKKKNLWKPYQKNKWNKKKEDAVKKEFIELFDECVSGVLRSSQKTGILLSGGLDSTAVACFAAPKCKAQGELLYSYTSVPETEDIVNKDPYFITNETKTVEITKEFLGNLSPKYMDLPGINGFTGSMEYVQKSEVPFKSLQNIRWMYALTKEAETDGCKIMLTGQYGNVSVSFGDIEMHLYSLFAGLRWKELYHEMHAYSKRRKIGRKIVVKYFCETLYRKMFGKKQIKKDYFKDCIVNPELLERYHVKERFLNKNNKIIPKPVYTVKSIRPHRVNKNALVQIGEFETHISLYNGILLRDPTKDKRLIEFCLSLPAEHFVHNGLERRLIREYLEDFLPKKVSQDSYRRGLQSADSLERLSKKWENIHEECTRILRTKSAFEILDVEKVKNALKKMDNDLYTRNKFESNKVLYSLMLVDYVENKKKTSELYD